MKPLLALIFALCAASLPAAELPPPDREVILTVTGSIAHTNGDGVARFDRGMIDALPQRETRTTTPWYDGSQSFTGPLVSAILDAVGATGGTVRVHALNDYNADVPVQDFRDHPVIFATKRNGRVLTVRDKGPLFIIYPFDEEPSLFNELYFGRSVWQIVRIEVLE